MNYIILNGKKSTMVKGLMIQSLPPISKPLMRTRIDEIDGRDGDIISKLGFSAYDKIMSIGLFGDFDIDEVIDYFNSEGEVIFSNEIDKKYMYQIIDQINFERLARFRQAEVAFHVQPFKYSSADDVQTISLTGKSSFTLENRGNTESRPTLTFTGNGSITVTIGSGTFSFSLSNSSITLDGEAMNAYIGSALANRSVSGDYNKLRLQKGTNTIAISGSLSSVVAQKVSRWI